MDQLSERIRSLESGERSKRPGIPILHPGLADVLPQRRLPAGSLVECLASTEGAGAWTVALLLGQQACASGRTLVIADDRGCFYPPAACRLGIDWKRTLLIRLQKADACFGALRQSLACPAIGAAIGRFDQLDATLYRRLQLAAETGGGVGLLLLPSAALRQPSFAAVRLLVSPMASAGPRRRLRVEAVRMRGERAGQSAVVELDHETGDVHLSAPMASAAPAA
ncbi:MAG: hypothetical protein K2X38_15365 [Gemmataceae bacterium]|nr:hypothetical protein [Gemmataceae bacterium]